jgi:hypothetical protein
VKRMGSSTLAAAEDGKATYWTRSLRRNTSRRVVIPVGRRPCAVIGAGKPSGSSHEVTMYLCVPSK